VSTRREAALAGAGGCGCLLVAIALKLALVAGLVYVVIRVARYAWGTP
jgi:hypothetical protein